MKILITGGAGFIASHITDAYIAAGHKVVIVDDLSTGFRKNLNPKAKFYKANIRDRAAIDRIMKHEKPEIVNHHAAAIVVTESVRNPEKTFEINVIGTLNVAASFAASGKQKKKMIFSSTGGAIYGEPKKMPADESTPANPLSPYGLSKKLDEEVVKFYASQYGFDYFIFRYPNVYGPRQNPKGEAGVVAIFSGIMKAGKRPTIFGDGTKARDYLNVHDIAHANLLALRRGKNETVNLGWGKFVTDNQIFSAIAKATNFKQKPIYAPYRAGEVYKISLDARRAKRILGWKPKMKLQEGIEGAVAGI